MPHEDRGSTAQSRAALARRDEIAEISQCLQETLRDASFAAVLVMLITGNGLGLRRGILRPGVVNGEGH
jgi:hypothetical protein